MGEEMSKFAIMRLTKIVQTITNQTSYNKSCLSAAVNMPKLQWLNYLGIFVVANKNAALQKRELRISSIILIYRDGYL